MLRIIAEPETLSPAQRQAIANFIVNYPTVDLNLTEIPTFTVASDDEDSEHEPSPEQVFGVTETPAAATPSGVALDKHGLPWDERIHTSSKAANADGSWRRKRGVDDATVTKVEGELRALMSIPTPAPVAEVAPPPPPAAVPAPPATAMSFVEFLQKTTKLIGAKKIAMEQVNAIVSNAGVESLSSLQSRPDLLPVILASINAAAIA